MIELFDEPPDREVRHRPDIVSREVESELAKPCFLHLGVLMRPEVLLEPAQLADECSLWPCRQQGSEGLEQVAKPLGVFAEIVERLRRGLGRDEPPVFDQPAVRSGDPPP